MYELLDEVQLFRIFLQKYIITGYNILEKEYKNQFRKFLQILNKYQ